MTAIGDVIEQGKLIPDVVIEVVDSAGDEWTRRDAGWICTRVNVRRGEHSSAQGSGWLSRNWGPLTVTAVREPEPDEVVHYRIPSDASPLTLCGLDVWEDSTSVTERAGSSNCAECRAAADEDKPETGRCPSCDSPQPSMHPAVSGGGEVTGLCPDAFHGAAPSALLDLVRQYGQARWNEGTELDGGSAWREARTEADFQFDRIAALVPHGVVPDGAVGDGPCHDCGAVNIRWYADSPIWNHVMGGPESRDDPGGILCVQCFVIRAYAAGYNPSAWRVSLPADPLVLSLPEVPRKNITLIGAKGTRFVPVGAVSWCAEVEGGRCFGLGELLDLAGTLTVEMAPPREPRTWPQWDVPTSAGPAPEYVTVQGWGTYGLREDGLYASTDGYPDDVAREHCLTFDALRALGDVTEVFDNEPGGEQR